MDFESSTFSKKPAYRYIRPSDGLPSTDKALDMGGDAPVLVKLFNPSGMGTWYITGYDPDTRIATGAAELFELEAGDFWMGELVDLRVKPFGLPIERDLYWTVKPLREVLA